MKLSLSIKIAVVVSVVLLCIGIAVYSFMRLNSVEQQQDFDLYTLVPQDAVAVFETDRVMEMLESVENMDCCKDGHYLQLSELFTCMRTFLNTWVEKSPHALSKQMNKILISFHKPGTSLDEVLYCALGTGDYQRIESFIAQYSSPAFPVKSVEYKGELIHIYPLSNGHFLAAYLTHEFMALSFQKRLLEQVIDARSRKQALAHNRDFRKMRADKQRNVASMLYVRMRSVPMGSVSDSLHCTSNLSEWMEFNLKFTESAIYCSGISYENDTLSNSFVNTVRRQQNISGYAGGYLPASTLLYESWSMSDKRDLLSFTASYDYLSAVNSAYMQQRDSEWLDYLEAYADTQIVSCIFRPEVFADAEPCAVVVIPLPDEDKARRKFLSWLQSTPREIGAPQAPRFNPEYSFYPCSANYRKYLLPRNTLFARLTGLGTSTFHSYACFYRGRLLLAADALSLSAYIDAMEKEETLQSVPFYKDITNTLASSCNFLLMADLNGLATVPPAYQLFVPTFFLRHINFFRHFTWALQFTCADGVVYPNATLLYRGSGMCPNSGGR